jgi:spore maturation protein A
MLNHIWLWMIILSLLIAAGSDIYHETAAPEKKRQTETQRNLNEDTKLGQVTSAAIEAVGLAVKIAIGLIGVMALWLGIMKVAEEAGMIRIIAKIVRPITKRLFPSIHSNVTFISTVSLDISLLT